MTELIWDGKYDAHGKRVPPTRIALPFQTIETINESAAERDRTRSLFADGGGFGETPWRNRLIWGDKRYVLPSLLPELAGQVNLIYIDPPFDTGADFSFTTTLPDAPDGEGGSVSFVKEPSVIEQKAYRDTWGKGLDSYLKWFYETVVLLRELLAENGSIYVHLDHHVCHYAKVVLDEVFGSDNFKSEIIWRRTFNSGSSKSLSNKFPVSTDTIFWFTKSGIYNYNRQYVDYSEGALKRYDKVDEQGRRFKWNPLKTVSKEKLERLMQAGEAKIIPTSKYPIYKHYLDEERGTIVDNLWNDVAQLGTFAEERENYATQKPEALLERIIKASSNPNDLVLDCFCGSGTTAAVAEKLGRRWITCDLGRFAIHTARKRLLAIPGVKPFVVENLGKYERQAWQKAEFGAEADALAQAYRNFILTLYRATPLTQYTWLHGVKQGRFVHIGDVAAPVSTGDVAQIAAEFKRATGTGKDAPTESRIDILGWDFAFEINEVAKQQASLAGIDARFVRIPREVLEKKAVDQGEIKFFELAALSVDVQTSGSGVSLTLKDFVIPLDDVPADIQSAITHWEQWVDYWAIDWDNTGDTFHNEWQAYRTRKDKTLQKTITHAYPQPGEYKIVVKVIDILGNDTTKTLTVTVGTGNAN